MEHLSWMIYLFSCFQGLLVLSVVILVISLIVFCGVFVVYCDGDCCLNTAIKWWKKSVIAIAISSMFVIIIPSKKTCYQIFGVNIIANTIKNSEALQKLPEKSFEAVNRFLDSIAPEDDDSK